MRIGFEKTPRDGPSVRPGAPGMSYRIFLQTNSASQHRPRHNERTTHGYASQEGSTNGCRSWISVDRSVLINKQDACAAIGAEHNRSVLLNWLTQVQLCTNPHPANAAIPYTNQIHKRRLVFLSHVFSSFLFSSVPFLRLCMGIWEITSRLFLPACPVCSCACA